MQSYILCRMIAVFALAIATAKCAVNRPSPAEAVEKVSARLAEVQHAIQFWQYLIRGTAGAICICRPTGCAELGVIRHIILW